jgi:hypothetical protein
VVGSGASAIIPSNIDELLPWKLPQSSLENHLALHSQMHFVKTALTNASRLVM